MLDREELRRLIELDREEEEIASEMVLLRPLDVLVIFQMFWMIRLDQSWTFENIRKQLNNYRIFEEEVAEAIYRLKREGMLIEKPKNHFDAFNLAVGPRIGLPVDWKELSEEECDNLMHRRMKEARIQIKAWKEVRRAPNEVRKAKKEIESLKSELERFQRDLLGTMITVFAVFVAIFSFIIIGTNTAFKIQLTREVFSFKEIFLQVSALLLPIFLILSALLIISYFLTRR